MEEIEAIVKPCGLGHSKARDISACMKIIKEQYDGNVPDDFDALLKRTARTKPYCDRCCLKDICPKCGVE